MDEDSREKALAVALRLSALSDLFAFCWFARDHADFQKDSMLGLSEIVSQCAAELGEAAGGEPGDCALRRRPAREGAVAEGP